MTCRELADLLFDYVAGELAQEQAELVRQHLGKCRPCGTYITTYQITIRLSRQLPLRPMPDDLLKRLHKMVDSLHRELG